jgi:hypothetical protein
MCAFVRRAQYFLLIYLASILVFAGHNPVRAGPFMQEAGKGQIIVTTTFDKSDRFFDTGGRLRPLAQYRKFEMTTYSEYGATDWLTLIFAPSSSRSLGTVGLFESSDNFMRLEAGARIKVWQNDNSIVSVQATARVPYAINPGMPFPLRREVTEFDLRALYGYSFNAWGRDGFASAEFAYRLRASAADEWRADFTLGYRVVPRFLLLVQNFNMAAGGWQWIRPQRWHRLQLSGVFDFTDAWSMQVGAYTTLLAVNARRDLGVTGGIWRKF